jgi:hypothetical protein
MSLSFGNVDKEKFYVKNTDTFIQTDTSNLFDKLHLSALGMKRIVFDKAMNGCNKLKEKNQIPRSGLLTIIDFSQSSNSKRLYIIDLDKLIVVFNTYVAHGKNSGDEYAIAFANKLNSYKSSLGFYLSEQTYYGAHGLSMRLKGLEKGINDDAENRGIVMHGATYVSESFIKSCGRLGRSQGCPAVPQELCLPIINYIKNGSCIYVYYPDSKYLKLSSFG